MNPGERTIKLQSSFGTQPVNRKPYRYFATAVAWLLAVSPGFAQDAASGQNRPQPSQPEAALVLPAGTQIPLALQRGISTRTSRPGDVINLLTTAPVIVADRAVIPPNTFVQGAIAELSVPGFERDGILRLHSVHLIFANGYTVGVPYDVVLRLDRQWIYPEPPSAGKRAGLIAAFAAPAAGALIGGLSSMHSPPPLTLPVPGQPLTAPNLGNPVKGAAIGFAAGLAVTIPVTVSILRHHKDFFIEGGVPSEMILEAPLPLEADRIAGLPATDAESHSHAGFSRAQFADIFREGRKGGTPVSRLIHALR
jgi:hypothetical protein